MQGLLCEATYATSDHVPPNDDLGRVAQVAGNSE